MASSHCKVCGSRSLVRDNATGSLLCASCGKVAQRETYEAHIGGVSGPAGTFVRVGTSGAGSVLPYREKKIFEAQKLIGEFTSRLGLSDSKSHDVKNMIVRITQGEYGQGDWFPVLIGACACVVMRSDSLSLPIANAASVIGCDTHELGRMITRVVDFLDLRKDNAFPVYNIVTTFVQAVGGYSGFRSLSKDEIGNLKKQGVFVIQCAIKWFLTTGRRPLPVVAAVLVFVAELNKIQIRIDDVAEELHAAASTLKRRYKELLEALVEASQALPWGKDVTVKNVIKYAPTVIQYMEMRSMLKGKGGGQGNGFDLEDIVSQCLRLRFEYESDNRSNAEDDSRYFDDEDRIRSSRPSLSEMKLSHESLSLAYSKFLEEKGCNAPAEDTGNGAKRMTGIDLYACNEWWNGESDLSKKLMLKQILEQDVGMDPPPPSFLKGCMVYKRRRERINAAKQRINRIMSSDKASPADVDCKPPNPVPARKRRRKEVEVDWEDFIIETLLLHKVKEEEIEKGHYNTLLDLYVFNSGIV